MDSEFSVGRKSLNSAKTIRSAFANKILATAYQWHNYGKTTIGARSDIENVSIDRLQAFYKMYYQPDNAVLLVAGKIDEAKTLDLVNKYFSPLPKPTRVLPKIYTDEPNQDGERQVTFVVSAIQIVWRLHIPQGSQADCGGFGDGKNSGRNAFGQALQSMVENEKKESSISQSVSIQEPASTLRRRLRKEVRVKRRGTRRAKHRNFCR